MGRKETPNAPGVARYLQSLEGIGLGNRWRRPLVNPAQRLQRSDHPFTAGVAGATRIGAKFALAGKPADNNEAQQ